MQVFKKVGVATLGNEDSFAQFPGFQNFLSLEAVIVNKSQGLGFKVGLFEMKIH